MLCGLPLLKGGEINGRLSFVKLFPGKYLKENIRGRADIRFEDIAPTAPIHYLVIPKQHISKLDEITPENSAVIAHIYEVIAKLAKDLDLKDGFRVVSNCGEQAGQSVFHIHFHLLAGRPLAWPAG